MLLPIYLTYNIRETFQDAINLFQLSITGGSVTALFINLAFAQFLL